MSECSILYISAKWGITDITIVLDRNYSEVSVKPSQTQPNCYEITVDNHRIFCITPYEISVGICTYLSVTKSDKGINILRTIADTFGGIFCESDYYNSWTMHDGKLATDDGLPFSITYAIIRDGINPDDLHGLIKSISKWNNDMSEIFGGK